MEAAALGHQLVERADVGLGGGHHRVGVGGTRGHQLALGLVLQPHRHLGLGVRAFGHGVHLVEGELRLVRDQLHDGVEGGINRPVARRLHGLLGAGHIEGERCRLRADRTGDHREGEHLDAVLLRGDLLVDEGFEILVVDVLLAVGKRLEAVEGVFQRILAELVAHFLELGAEGVAARVLAHHQRGLGHADRSRGHDLVGLGMLEHAVLVDAALVREGIPADDGLVVLHGERRRCRHELGGAVEHAAVDAHLVGQHVAAGLDGHHDLFQRRVAGALADAVDGAFHLPRAGADARERVGNRHAEIVVAVHREDRLVGHGHVLAHVAEHVEVFLGRRVADGIGQVDGGGAGLDGRLDALAEIVEFRARRILRAPLHVRHPLAGARDLELDHLEHLLLALLQLVLAVHGAGREEGMDARALGMLHGLAGAIDVRGAGP